MKRKVTDVIAVAAVISVLAIVIFSCRHTYTDYFDTLGIWDLAHGDETPSEEKTIDGQTYKYYDGICLVYDEANVFMRAEIIDGKYSLEKGIKVRSERKDVEEAFENKTKITGLRENEFGFLETDFIWVHFIFDKDEKVNKIKIYQGP